MRTTDTSARLAEAAKAAGIGIPASQHAAIAAGADWLRSCVEMLRKAGLGR